MMMMMMILLILILSFLLCCRCCGFGGCLQLERRLVSFALPPVRIKSAMEYDYISYFIVRLELGYDWIICLASC